MTGNSQAGSEQTGKPKLIVILGRLTGGPAGQACLLHEKLTPFFETRLVTGGLSPGEHDMSYLLSSGRNVLRLEEMSREVSFLSDVRAFWKILRLLRRERPDIVHTQTAKAGALGRLAAWLARVPVIVHTYHGHVFHGYFSPAKTRMYLVIERALGLITTQVIAISESQREELCVKYRVVSAEKTKVIQNGFDFIQFSEKDRQEARQELGLRPQDFVLVWAGRMAPVKDVGLLGQVIRKAAACASKAFFLVVGDGEQSTDLESMIQGYNNVRLLGWRRDMGKIWGAADAAILTSLNEGTPSTLIEAMAAGLPFVATNVGGVQDLAAGGMRELPDRMGHRASNGFLTARTPEALFYAIEELIGDLPGTKEMGTAGRAFVAQRFSSDRLVAEIKLLYEQLMQEDRKKRNLEIGPPERRSSKTKNA